MTDPVGTVVVWAAALVVVAARFDGAVRFVWAAVNETQIAVAAKIIEILFINKTNLAAVRPDLREDI